MKLRKFKKFIFILTGISLLVLVIYVSFLYRRAQYSIGRSGIDAKIRVFLIDLTKISHDTEKLRDRLNTFSLPAYENSEFKFSIYQKSDDCFGIDDSCVEAKSVQTYNSKNDIFILGLKNGKVEQVSDMGPANFLEWILMR